ncbi:ligase-associated DNA damage response endonuclease PdeM [Pedobacter sp. AW31-3R]|uniref:ligase-associated DNA damage response endonuclease PdeM n=1 Tax=Pedobacter sp. AW31-3R TaxID=3445781 RepID=UPI003FA127AC
MTISCKGEELILSKDRAIFWASKKMLIISDLHLGKSATFRMAGIPVPSTIGNTDLHKLTLLIGEFVPEVLLITGDMFHYQLNSDTEVFREWRAAHASLKIILVKGNHDRLKESDYAGLNIDIRQKELLCGPFRFVHDQPEQTDGYYNITGHIHPGVTVFGKSRQRLRLPCFYFGKNCAILPAFSQFTGLSKIKTEEGDQFYAITPSSVVAV